ncbi:peptidase inhibitor family I36 protein [Streptomyces rubiginosohelvolus]|uniref:peptidase inhibitor family I36 protein n=1 Tax=Streptomyces sp. CB02130 TaxID=1703934 RepID=UPI00093FC6FC|nr:peptidase inhibitor family I36 protein [Streptomyces sp. CB02130]
MKKLRFISIALAALAAVGTSIITTSPAAAVGGCPSGKACLYSGKNFTTLRVTTASTNACYRLDEYGFKDGTVGVRSWVNNLPVNVSLWEVADPYQWHKTQTLGAGAFSSDTSVSQYPYWYSHSEYFCMGSAKPSGIG